MQTRQMGLSGWQDLTDVSASGVWFRIPYLEILATYRIVKNKIVFQHSHVSVLSHYLSRARVR